MTSGPHGEAAWRQPAGPQGLSAADGGGMLVYTGLRPAPEVAASPLSAADIAAAIEMAGRAPSVHNTQPWKFRPRDRSIEVLADASRLLPAIDPAGRELLISCGAALFGLRLGLRSVGRLPVVDLLPDAARPALLARVWCDGHAGASPEEAELIAAVPHRHTHRGAFSPSEVPPRLLDTLVAEAAAEGCELVVLTSREPVERLAQLTRSAAADQLADASVQRELERWVQPSGSQARDGVPARARLAPAQAGDAGPGSPGCPAERLPRRSFGLPGTDLAGDEPPGATAVLLTTADQPADWLRAGQALNRLLVRAASRWVFASLQSQPLELPGYREQVRALLAGDGYPQMLLQFGRANTAPATPRRRQADVVTNDPDG